ncbi:MAG: FAD-dependent monooxygenase [Caulobacteraceae bacterium]
MRPLLSHAAPVYEGVVFVELGFEVQTHGFVDALTGRGKMFAVGDNRALVGQRNGNGHIRGYAGWRATEQDARDLAGRAEDQVRAATLEVFDGWAPVLTDMIRLGELLGARPLYALPVGHRWTSRPGLTLLGDAAHLMSPFAGEGVNLALADAADLAEALTSGHGWAAVARAEAVIAGRATAAAKESAAGLAAVFSPDGAARVLDHYRGRTAG